jgi:3-isopropylmalate/(R)-2-methylmalate dehydratase small subunit
LQGAGVKVVIAPSFADIFAGNSAKNGLLLITLADESVRTVLRLAQETRLALSVDLQGQTVSAKDGLQWHFDYDPFRKHCLLHGLDDLDYLRSRLGQILQKKQELKDSWFYRADIPNR